MPSNFIKFITKFHLIFFALFLVACNSEQKASEDVNTSNDSAEYLSPPPESFTDDVFDQAMRVTADFLTSNYVSSANVSYSSSGKSPSVDGVNHYTGDLNGDGKADLILQNKNTGLWVGYLMDGLSITSKGYIDVISNLDWEVISINDLNGDNKSDFLMRNSLTGQWTTYLMNGLNFIDRGSINATTNLDWEVVSVNDLNGDEKADILLRNSQTGQWTTYLMNGREFVEKGSIPATQNLDWEVISIADLNGDARADILLRNYKTGQWTTYLLDGRIVISKGSIAATTSLDWEVASIADLNGDSSADILLRNRQSGKWVTYLLNGRSIIDKGYIDATSSLNWQIKSIGDLNGDGSSDILLRNITSGKWVAYMLNGRVIIDKGYIEATNDLNWEPTSLRDYNGDGTIDILVRNRQTGRWVSFLMAGRAFDEKGTVSATQSLDWDLPAPLLTVSDYEPTVYTFNINNGVDIATGIEFTASIDSSNPKHKLSSYRWDMGDGTIYENISTVEHSYQYSGTKTILAEAIDRNGVLLSGSTLVDVDYYSVPRASFYGPFTNIGVGEKVDFDASTSYKFGGSINTYEWTFSDGTTDSGITVNKSFSEAGKYDVTLTVTDNHGTSAVASKSFSVDNGDAPSVYLFSTNSYGKAPLAVTFRTSVYDWDSNSHTYLWEFGDGATSTDNVSNLNHTYTKQGTYDAKVTVTDPEGNQDTTTTKIYVTSSATYSVDVGVTLSSSIFLDSDVNDAGNVNISNDSVEVAQTIGNVGIVNGYVTAEATGNTANQDQFAAQADELDFYQTYLTASQRIFLNISDHDDDSEIDLDLYLVGSTGSEIIVASESTDGYELITVPESGDYYIVVQAFAKASNYQIELNYQGALVATASTQLEFVPGEIVGYRQLKGNASQKKALYSSYLKQGSAQNSVLHKLELPEMKALQKAAKTASGAISYASSKPSNITKLGFNAKPSLILKMLTLERLKLLRKSKAYQSVDLNFILQTTALPNDPLQSRLWHYDNINLSSAWDITKGDTNNPIIVAVIDTGVFLAHEDLSAQLVTGYDFIFDVNNANDGDGIDNNPDDPGDAVGSNPSSYHGTHVAGTIAAATNNDKGISGIGWNTKIMPLRVLGKTGGSSYDISQAMLYAAGLNNNSGKLPVKSAQIINMSLGGPSFSQSDQNIVDQVRARGTIIVAAAGNDNSSLFSYPASYNGVISVAATDFNNFKAPYSNFGSKIDIAAPGGDTSADRNGDGYPDGVLSTLKNETLSTSDYDFYQGTSMAAPHVSGVIALMMAVRPSLTPDEIDFLLINNQLTNDIGTNGWDNLYGYGLLDAYKAVAAARDFDSLDVAKVGVELSVRELYFSSSNVSSNFNIVKKGVGQLSIESFSRSDAWITFNAVNADSEGFGQYRITIDATLPTGNYLGSITIKDSEANEYSITIRASIYNYTSDTTGNIYGILIDKVTEESVYTANTELDKNGKGQLMFDDVTSGEYYLLLGSDLDNDNFICDEGELCGGYPVLSDMQLLNVNDGNVTDITVVVGPSTNIFIQSTTNSNQGTKRNLIN